jgi:very-short-patch-repair endonuclease
VVKGFVVDFYCGSSRLAIEIDGTLISQVASMTRSATVLWLNWE